ncbi:hypothetical protein [Fervidibacter sacchari]
MMEHDDLPPLLKQLLKIMERTERYEQKERKRPKRSALPFHIQHNTTPLVVWEVLQVTEPILRIPSISQGTWSKIKPFLCQLGILARDGSLTPFGERLRKLMQIYPDLLAEAIHGHLYTAYRFDPTVRFSFAYATICDWLWERREVALTGEVLSELVGLVVRRGAEFYGIPETEIAFSTNSVRGALNWLKGLNPPVIERSKLSKRLIFRCRKHCHPLTVAWALSVWYRLNEIEVGEWLIWESELEEFLSRCLLLDDGCAKIAVEVAASWTGWSESVLEAQKRGEMLAFVRINRLLGWGEN